MSSMDLTKMQNDDFVDVDLILAKYRKSKSKVVFLVCALAMIFFGTVSSYAAIQFKSAQVETVSQSTLEFAKITATSEYCENNAGSETCQKAVELVKDPEKGLNPTSAPEKPQMVALVDNAVDLLRVAVSVPTQQPIK